MTLSYDHGYPPREVGEADTRVFGKHEGVVRVNLDPLMGGRVQVEVPSVLGSNRVWARPCVPYADARLGLFLMPPVGGRVWVEFAAGDTDQPIWSGAWWADGDVPSRDPTELVLATPAGTLRFNSKAPRADIRLDLPDGTHIAITGKSIVIDTGATGRVEVTAASTSVNRGALEVR